MERRKEKEGRLHLVIIYNIIDSNCILDVLKFGFFSFSKVLVLVPVSFLGEIPRTLPLRPRPSLRPLPPFKVSRSAFDQPLPQEVSKVQGQREVTKKI